jgi:hypothetical protein
LSIENSTRSRTLRACASVLALLILAGSAAPVRAQSGCELRVGQRTLELGEAVPIQFVCINTGQPSQPEIKVPDGLEVTLLNALPSQFSQMSFINGRRSEQTTYTYSLQMTGVREGTFRLGPATTVINGQRFQSDAVEIVVRKSEVNQGAKGDRNLWVELKVEPTSLYVTQTYTATLVIGIRKVEISGRTFDLDLLRQVLDLSNSQLSIFAGGSARQSEIRLTDSQGQSHTYVVYRVTKEVRGDSIGTTRVGPVFLRANYPTSLRRDVFGRLELSGTVREAARAEGIEVTVKGPPQQGRPETFTGAIGRYLLDVTVKPARIELGQPVTLTIALRGTPLEGLAGPDLNSHPELASRFEFARDELVGDIEAGAKVFRRAIFPKQAGEQTVPPISWTYFDPVKEEYVTLTSDPVPITVERGTARGETVTLLPTGPTLNEGPTLTLMTGGIAPNYVDPQRVLAVRTFSLWSAGGVSALALPPMLCLVVMLTARHRERLRKDAGYARRRRASRRAEMMIREALNHSANSAAKQGRAAEPEAAWSLLGSALTHYLSDRFNLGSGAMTPAEARDVLAANGFGPPMIDDVAIFLERCDGMRYAPGLTSHESIQESADCVRAWIREVESQR